MRTPTLPEGYTWSLRVLDAATGQVLAEHAPDTVCETASIGKVFLLIEVATRFSDGRLDPDERLVVPEEHRVGDSGLLHHFRDQAITLADAALLVGAVSDNLATNALIARCGLEEVRAVARELGYRDTELHDYIRSERGPGLPWTPSFGTAAELADLMMRLGAGEVRSSEVSRRVRDWLATGADTSMVAHAFLLDPLAHLAEDEPGMQLCHKTGTTGFARIDIGHVSTPDRSVAYAMAANWPKDGPDLREGALRAMHALGEEIRAHLHGAGDGAVVGP